MVLIGFGCHLSPLMGDGPIPEWTVGNGAAAVVVSGLSRDTEFAVPDSRAQRRGSDDVKFTEVGP